MKTFHQKTVLRTGGKQKIKLRFILRYGAIAGITGMAVFAIMFATGNLGTPKNAEAAVTTYTTLLPGSWTNSATVWSTNGLTPCLCTPTSSVSSKNVIINHAVTLNTDVTVSGTSSFSISKTGSLTGASYKLEIQGGSLTSDGTLSVAELKVLSGASVTFNGPVTGASRLRFEGSATLNALTTVTNGDIELKSGSTTKVADGWKATLNSGDIVNEGTMTFDGNIFTITKGDFINAAGGVMSGFGNIETESGTISNSGTWNTAIDWCASSNALSATLTDPENCLNDTVVSASTCQSSYTLDWKDPSTYTITCGDVNASNWIVKGMTCWYYSPTFSVAGSVGGPNRMASWSVRINQSGNIDDNDTASVYYYVNGILMRTDVYPGTGSPAVFTSTRKILVPSGGNYQVRIRLKNDKTNEMWEVKSDGVTACLLTIIPPPSPLPVALIDFTGKAQGSKVVLSWATAGEVNNDYFTLERSPNGYVFNEFATVEGAGTSSVIHKYSFADSQPFNGTTYYRLMQTDFDGKSTTYKIISVNIISKPIEDAALKISPNPFTQTFTAEFKLDEAKPVTIQLINVTGAIAFTENIMGEQGTNQYQFTTPFSLKPVAYHLRISNNNNVIASTKVICRK
ncbi:MAG: hypothetical protein ACHQNT_04255 [Bacteroidia bacterium]